MLTGCKDKTAAESSSVSAKPDVAEEKTENEEDPMIVISEERLREYGEESTSLVELLERLMPDTIVYKSAFGDIVYADIDETLQRHNYNWDNLYNVSLLDREFEYREDGVTKSLKGIDVSRYQGEIDWAKVKVAGVDFAMLRVGYRGYKEGVMVVDAMFEEYVKGALENDISVGVYFWSQAITTEEAVEEAKFVLDAIKPYRVTWPIVLDLENAPGSAGRADALFSYERTDIAVAFCDTISDAGYTPMIYSYLRWFIEEMDLSKLEKYDKWFAQYYNQPGFPYAMSMWQYADDGSVDGVPGDVDLNISFVDYDAKN